MWHIDEYLAKIFMNRAHLIEKLSRIDNSLFSVLIGFDGFTDEIISCVHKRHSHTTFTPVPTIKEFEKTIHAARKKSGNIELVCIEKRVGGNAPLLAHALLQTQHRVALIGTMGFPEIEPTFESLARKCTPAISIAPSSHTDALEFQDGKLLFGKLDALLHINEKLLLEKIGKKKLMHLFNTCDLFATVNWTMIPAMTDIWRFLHKEIFPYLSQKRRWMFVDLADPAKRTEKDLKKALSLLSRIQNQFLVCLGLNERESEAAARVLKIPAQKKHTKQQTLLTRAQALCKKLHIEQVVIHALDCAAASSQHASSVVDGPYCEKPFLSTGGGDNFNAGYCLGLLHHFSLEETLLTAVATSGFYVRTGRSPTCNELIRFILKKFHRCDTLSVYGHHTIYRTDSFHCIPADTDDKAPA